MPGLLLYRKLNIDLSARDDVLGQRKSVLSQEWPWDWKHTDPVPTDPSGVSFLLGH